MPNRLQASGISSSEPPATPDAPQALTAETRARDAEKQARDRAMTALQDLTGDMVLDQMARGDTMTDENKELLRKIIRNYEGLEDIEGEEVERR